MAKKPGQPEHRNICYKCKKAVPWEDKVRITTFVAEPDPRWPNISSHVERVLEYKNLCMKCYNKYTQVLKQFLEEQE